MSGSGRQGNLIGRLALVALLAAPSGLAAKTCPSLHTRVMTYNIRLDTIADGANGWPQRRRHLIGQIELVRPDLFGLQEVMPSQRQELMAALSDYEFLGVAREDGQNSGEYSPLGIRRSEFAVMGSGTFWLSETPDRPSLGWDAAYRRIVTWARLRHRRTTARLLVLNTHWDHQGVLSRENSAVLITEWLSRNRKKDEQLLVLGDFNADFSEPSMRRLLAYGLRDSRAVAADRALGASATFNNFQLVAPSGTAIDHIIIGPSWNVGRYWTIAQHVDGRVPSDHYPVVADLEAILARCRR